MGKEGASLPQAPVAQGLPVPGSLSGQCFLRSLHEVTAFDLNDSTWRRAWVFVCFKKGFCVLFFSLEKKRDAWVAQSVKCLTLGFCSGHNLTVHGFKPHTGLHAVSVLGNSHPLSLALPQSLSLSLSQNK